MAANAERRSTRKKSEHPSVESNGVISYRKDRNCEMSYTLPFISFISPFISSFTTPFFHKCEHINHSIIITHIAFFLTHNKSKILMYLYFNVHSLITHIVSEKIR